MLYDPSEGEPAIKKTHRIGGEGGRGSWTGHIASTQQKSDHSFSNAHAIKPKIKKCPTNIKFSWLVGSDTGWVNILDVTKGC